MDITGGRRSRSRIPGSVLGFAIFTLTCLGCSQATPLPGVTEVDSAGVTIVVNGTEQMAGADRWSLGASPRLVIESDQGGVTLYDVFDMVRTESGIIAVTNRGTDEILLFDGDGRFVGRRGREGDGPGEFRWLSSVLALGGDTIATYDFSHKRLSVFSPQGEVARELSLAPLLDGSDFEEVMPLSGGGLAVFVKAGMSGAVPGVFRASAESFAMDRDGRRIGSFGEIPGAEMFLGDMAGRTLFGPNTYATVVGEELVVGTAEEPEVRFYGTDASLRRIVRWQDHDREVTDAAVEAFIAAAEEEVPQARAMLSNIPRSDRKPAFDYLLSAPGGGFWVGHYSGPGMALPGARFPAREWLVFASSGALRARISTPPGFHPLYLDNEEVMGVFTDELGVETIRVYDVIRELE